MKGTVLKPNEVVNLENQDGRKISLENNNGVASIFIGKHPVPGFLSRDGCVKIQHFSNVEGFSFHDGKYLVLYLGSGNAQVVDVLMDRKTPKKTGAIRLRGKSYPLCWFRKKFANAGFAWLQDI